VLVFVTEALREIETEKLHHKNELAIVSGVLTLLVFL
jgi:hypothetical protein